MNCKENSEKVLTRKLGSAIIYLQRKLCNNTIKLGKENRYEQGRNFKKEPRTKGR